MKKRLFLLFLVVGLFSACQHDVFLPKPNIYPDNGRADSADSVWQAPRELKATQGAKRIVNLKWKSVNNAVRYNIYRAENQFSSFIQVGETKGRECEFEIKAEPGFDMYYRVTAVDGAGKESNMSNIERATTLSKPIINSVEGKPEMSDSDVYVSWYMNNADAYSDSVYYNVVCLDESKKEVQRQVTKGNNTTVLFTGLNPNTNYFYKVEAYNSENEFEESEIVDAATARRLRPDPATNLNLTQGLSKDSISLSFVLPNFVDITAGKNLYEPAPIYFKIYRRVYKEGINTEPFVLIKDDFGVNKDSEGVIDYTKVKFGETAEDYTPGNVVTFVDNSKELKRGEKYEYSVQSFAYTKRDISSTESVAQTEQPGWLLPESSFDVQNFSYIKDESDNKTGAVLNFKFAMETYGVPYKYKILEIKRTIDGATEPDKVLTELDAVASINNYIKEFKDLTAEEGYYKYKIVILAPDGTELDSYEAVGESLVTANEIPTIGNITITSGYADKIVLKWNQTRENSYTLKYWDDGVAGKEALVENKNPSIEGPCEYEDNTAKPGVVRTYQLVVNNGKFDVPSKIMEATVPMKPELSSKYAYDKISVVVNNGEAANKANYTVSAAFEDSTLDSAYKLKLRDTGVIAPIAGLEPLVFDYEIIKNSDGAVPSDVIDASVAGAKVNVTITEKRPLNIRTYVNEVEANGENGAVFTEVPPFTDVPGDEQLLSNKITTAYVGPALLNQTASQGTNADNITVTWDKVLGADSYVVFRDRYHLGRSGKKDDLELQNSISDKYIVTLNKDGTVTVKCDDAELEASELSKYVSAVYSAETNKFTLTDKYRAKADTDAGNQWRTGQAEITWGAPNKYTVIPVLSVADGDNSSKDKNTVSIDKLKIENIKNVDGGTIGYGWNVKASQGTYFNPESVVYAGENVNTAIKIEWVEPFYSNKTLDYTLFRKEATSNSEWKAIAYPKKTNYYIDDKIEQGKIYDYAVIHFDVNIDKPDLIFVESQKKGNGGTEINDSLGFVLPNAEITSVVRPNVAILDEELVFSAKPEINAMIKGYVVQIKNSSINDKWVDVIDIPITDINQKTFKVNINNENNRLKVLRSKPYHIVRSYTISDGKRILSEPLSKGDNAYNNFVKEGCENISNKEFARAALIGMSLGMEKERGNKGTGHSGVGIPGLQSTAYDQGWFNYKLHIDFSNYDTGVVTINGKLIADGLQGNYPYHYNSSNVLELTYNGVPGTIQIKGDVSRDQGTIVVNFNGETINYNMGKGELGYLPFPVNGKKPDYLNNTPEWQ